VRGFLTGVETATAVTFLARNDGLTVRAKRLEEHPTECNAAHNYTVPECSENAPS
jgi:hypothetical protein